jgi:membrane protein required for colicin V production
MMIDIIIAVLLAVAIFKGYRRGIILAVFSFIAVFVGLAAAMKLSVTVADYLHRNGMDGKWLSFVSFLLVLVAVGFLVWLAARFIQGLMEKVLLGWANRLAGVVLYAFLYLTVFSVILFYVEKLGLLAPETLSKSVGYPVIKNLGPWLIDNFGKIIPWFKNMFDDLGKFFGGIAEKAA